MSPRASSIPRRSAWMRGVQSGVREAIKAVLSGPLAHVPEKQKPVFRKGHAPINEPAKIAGARAQDQYVAPRQRRPTRTFRRPGPAGRPPNIEEKHCESHRQLAP